MANILPIHLLVVIVGILMFLAPLGIWNRLIKMHRDAERHAKRAEAQRERIIALLEAVVNGAEEE